MNILERNGREADSRAQGPAMPGALARLGAGGFSVGIEAPLDNDWTH